jgi:hypothetical protein
MSTSATPLLVQQDILVEDLVVDISLRDVIGRCTLHQRNECV